MEGTCSWQNDMWAICDTAACWLHEARCYNTKGSRFNFHPLLSFWTDQFLHLSHGLGGLNFVLGHFGWILKLRLWIHFLIFLNTLSCITELCVHTFLWHPFQCLDIVLCWYLLHGSDQDLLKAATIPWVQKTFRLCFCAFRPGRKKRTREPDRNWEWNASGRLHFMHGTYCLLPVALVNMVKTNKWHW